MDNKFNWTKVKSIGRIIVLLFIMFIVGVLAVSAAVSLYYWPGLGKEVAKIQDLDSLLQSQLEMPLQVYSADNKLIAEFGEHRRTKLKYEEIPQDFIHAILAAEDDEFFHHIGIDIKGLMRSFLELVSTGSKQTGASTITMQTARNYLLTLDRTFTRKFREILLSLYMEQVLTKEQIMELYINKIFLGHRAYGIAAAAQIYYGKGISELTLAQHAMIAGIPKAPSRFNPLANSRRALIRRNWILKRMYSLGMIDVHRYTEAISAPITAKYHAKEMDLYAPYVAEMARSFIEKKIGDQAYTKGLKVYTSVDSLSQEAANVSLKHGLLNYDKRHGFRGFEKRDIPPYLEKDTSEEDELEELAEDTQALKNLEKMLRNEKKEELKRILGIDVENWLGVLSKTPVYAGLEPAIVVKAEPETIYALLANGEMVYIPYRNFAWAGKYVSPTYKIAKAPEGHKFAKTGDLIRVELVDRKDLIEFESPFKSDKDRDYKDVYEGISKIEMNLGVLSQVPFIQGAFVALNPKTGGIKSLVGGFDFKLSKYNRAEQAIRQAGSILKPFVYLSALEKSYTAATIINDAPIVIEDSTLEGSWRPKNSDGKFDGPMRMREGLYRSRNLISIRILQDIGVKYGRDYVLRFGFRDESLPHNLSLALGTANVTPLEMVSAYSVLANGGYRVNSYLIERIEDSNGDILYQHREAKFCNGCDYSIPVAQKSGVQNNSELANQDEAQQEVNQDTVKKMNSENVAPNVIDDRRSLYIMHSMLQDVIKKGTARAAKSLDRGDLHGKTGTTNEQKDAWFSGFNGNLVATVWTGFDNPSSTGEYGSNLALPIWVEYMQQILPSERFATMYRPSGLVTVRINEQTGKKARAGEDGMFEIFKTENVPAEEQDQGFNFAKPSESDDAETGEGDSTSGLPESLF